MCSSGRCIALCALALCCAQAGARAQGPVPSPVQDPGPDPSPDPSPPPGPSPGPNPDPSPNPNPVPDPSPDPNPPAPTTSASPASASPADLARYARAREVIARGEALFGVDNYDAALSEFERAYRLLAGHPRRYIVLHNLALCHERMFRYDSALEYYERYLREGGPAAEDRAQIEAVVRTLLGLLGTVHIESNVRAELWIDNRRLGDAPASRRLPAGRHVVELRAPLYESARREIDVRARGQQPLRFSLQRLSKASGPSPAFFWTAAGLTGAAAITGTVLGVAALSEDAHNKELQREDHYLVTLEDEQRVERLSTAATVALSAAAVLAVGSTVLYFLTDWDAGEHERAAAPRPLALRVQPWVEPQSAGLGLQGELR